MVRHSLSLATSYLLVALLPFSLFTLPFLLFA